MRGKYRRRKDARLARDRPTVSIDFGPYGDAVTRLIGMSPDDVTRVIAKPIDLHIIDLAEFDAIMAAIEQAKKLKRAKKKGCSNLDRNMETLGYRRVCGDEMVPEQFEAISREKD